MTNYNISKIIYNDYNTSKIINNIKINTALIIEIQPSYINFYIWYNKNYYQCNQ